MSAVLLLVLVTTVELLLGNNAAYLEHPNWEDDIMSYPQDSYPSFDTEYLEEMQAQYKPFGAEDIASEVEHDEDMESISDSLLEKSDANDGYSVATTEDETCTKEFNSMLKELLEKKKECAATGFDDCCQIKNLIDKAASGLYDFNRFCGAPCEPFSSVGSHYTLHGYCDMEIDHGGWLVIQRRSPAGTVNFSRSWEEYETGFGDLKGEFWYGLRNLHCLTSRDDIELHIDMVTKESAHLTTTFDTFKVAGAGDRFKLTIGGGKGHRPENFMYNNGQYFSTYDQDNDKSSGNCAASERGLGGWWYNSCSNVNLNGNHNNPTTMFWKGDVLTASEMKIRPKKCLVTHHFTATYYNHTQ